MTSSLQIRATNAATQCEQSCFTRRCGVYAFCSRLISAHTHTHLHYTLCSHHRNANILHSFSLVRTWARLRTILSRGTCLFLHTGPFKSQLKTPTLTKVGPKPYVSYTISPPLPLPPHFFTTAFLPSISKTTSQIQVQPSNDFSCLPPALAALPNAHA
jgi:hypothetical protein